MKTTNAILLGVTAMTGIACKSNAPVQQERPNILFILTDDQRWDAMGYAGNPYIKTPNMDRLAGDGVYFRNTYATTPISCASRASIFSGMYASTSGIHDFDTPFTQEQMQEIYPVVMRDAGYFTGFIGKYGVGQSNYEGVPERFDFWRSYLRQGFYFDPANNGEHLTAVQGRQAIEFLDSAKVSGKPFCLQVSFKAPHCQDSARPKGQDEFPIDPRDEHLYDGVTFPEPFTNTEEYYQQLNPNLRHSESRNLDNEGKVRWRYRFDNPEKYQNTVRKYYSLISGVDREIGNIMEALKERGMDKNTVIIFLGDNGFYLGEHALAGKWFGHEESIRLPMFIYDPRAEKSRRGVTDEHMVLNVDIPSTILGLAGVEIPSCMQGENLTPLLNGEDPKDWRTEYYVEHRFNPVPVFIPSCEGIIRNDCKLLHYFTADAEWWEMYDLTKDINELDNVIDNPEYADMKAELSSRFNVLRSEVVR